MVCGVETRSYAVNLITRLTVGCLLRQSLDMIAASQTCAENLIARSVKELSGYF
jgi:hypothetical protein